MFHILDSKPAHGELTLFYEWKEDSAGYNDEETTKAKLEVGPDGDILLREFSEYISCSPHGGGRDIKECIYSISVTDLIQLIKNNGIQKR